MAIQNPCAPVHHATRRMAPVRHPGRHQCHARPSVALHMGQGQRHGETASRQSPDPGLLAKALVGLPAQHPAQLRVVVAQLRVGIQRQMVGKQVDVMRQQQAAGAASSSP